MRQSFVRGSLAGLAAQGFEIAWHGATLHTSPRPETLEGLERFRALFGADPKSMAKHYNGEALYPGGRLVSPDIP